MSPCTNTAESFRGKEYYDRLKNHSYVFRVPKNIRYNIEAKAEERMKAMEKSTMLASLTRVSSPSPYSSETSSEKLKDDRIFKREP